MNNAAGLRCGIFEREFVGRTIYRHVVQQVNPRIRAARRRGNGGICRPAIGSTWVLYVGTGTCGYWVLGTGYYDV